MMLDLKRSRLKQPHGYLFHKVTVLRKKYSEWNFLLYLENEDDFIPWKYHGVLLPRKFEQVEIKMEHMTHAESVI